MRKILIFGLLTLLTAKSYALSADQRSAACSIAKYAKHYPNREGLNYKTLLVAIALVESSLCKNLLGDISLVLKGRGAPSLGCFQFQLRTARWVIFNDPRLKKYRSISYWSLSQRLLNDIRFQTELASRYLEWILIHYGRKGLWRWNGSRAYLGRLERALPKARLLIKYCERRKK